MNSSSMNDNGRFGNLSRRNTVAGADSPFSSRRHLVLQSTPITQVRTNPVARAMPTLDVSEITSPAITNNPENPLNSLRTTTTTTEDRNYRPHLFGKLPDAEDASRTKQRLETSLHPNSSFNFNSSMDVDRPSTFLAPGNPLRRGGVERVNTFNVARTEVANGFAKESNKKTITFTPPTKDVLKPRGGPPLRSLNDFKPAVKRPRLMEGFSEIPNRQTSVDDQAEYWVTVCGFDPETQTDDVLELFGRHGQIVQSEKPTGGYNFIYIRYATTVHVDQALDRSGQLIGKNMIGVFRKKKNSELRSIDDTNKVWVDNEKNSSLVEFTSNIRPSLSGSRNESRTITGIRSAATSSPGGVNGASSSGIMGRLFGAFK